MTEPAVRDRELLVGSQEVDHSLSHHNTALTVARVFALSGDADHAGAGTV